MQPETDVKRQVRQFYDQVGWQGGSDGFYQNATYEDLRAVSHEYIHKCHLRVLRHINPTGRLLLDAGSGPIQYPEYLEYSRGYQRRVCADISLVALQEGRKRIGSHGLFVVCDVARLPFATGVFDGAVSLHTFHHLPPQEHVRAYQELHRTLSAGARAAVVNGWDKPPMTVFLDFWVSLFQRLYALFHPGVRGAKAGEPAASQPQSPERGTYVHKHQPTWLCKEVGSQMPISIWCWRSVNVRFLRTFIHARTAGRFLLMVLYWKEELLPHFFGRYGQYPLIELGKR